MSRSETKQAYNPKFTTDLTSYRNYTLVDLHGQSHEQAKKTVIRHLIQANSQHISRLRIVTGRGNHKNKSGQRGLLYKSFQGWIEEADLGHIIESMTRHDGYYEICLKPTSVDTPTMEEFKNALEAFAHMTAPDIEAKANAGDADCQHLHAKFLEQQQDFKQAFHYYQLAADNNCTTAMHEVGRCYVLGLGTRRSEGRAFTWFKKALSAGYHLSACSLADYYWLGIDRCRQDYKKAIEYYRIAANAGVPIAMRKLAFAYRQGLGTAVNLREAFQWYKQSADLGERTSQFNVAVMYQKGQGTISDEAAAFKYFLLSAKQGDPDAQFYAGQAYLNGCGVEKDSTEGLIWIKRAADNQSQQANFFLARYNEHHEDKTTHFQRAALAGHPLAMIAALSSQQEDITQEEMDSIVEQVAKMSLQADEEDILRFDDHTKFMMIDFMLQKRKKSLHQKALTVLRRGANEGCIYSLRRLSTLYRIGLAVRINHHTSIQYLKKCIMLKDGKSCFLLGFLYDYGLPNSADNKMKACQFYNLAARYNNPKGYLHLALMLFIGKALPQDIPRALTCLHKAIELEASKQSMQSLRSGILDGYDPVTEHVNGLISVMTIALCGPAEPGTGMMNEFEEKTTAHYCAGFDFDHDFLNAGLPCAPDFKAMGNDYFHQHNFTHAILCYDVAHILDTQIKEVLFNRGLCHLKQKQLTLAMKDFDKAIALDGTYDKPIYHKAKLLLTLAQSKKALQTIRAYQSLGGTSAAILQLTDEKATPPRPAVLSTRTNQFFHSQKKGHSQNQARPNNHYPR